MLMIYDSVEMASFLLSPNSLWNISRVLVHSSRLMCHWCGYDYRTSTGTATMYDCKTLNWRSNSAL